MRLYITLLRLVQWKLTFHFPTKQEENRGQFKNHVVVITWCQFTFSNLQDPDFCTCSFFWTFAFSRGLKLIYLLEFVVVFRSKTKSSSRKMGSDGFFHIDSTERFQSRFQQLYKYRPFYSCGRSILAFEWTWGWGWPFFDTNLFLCLWKFCWKNNS